jgi:hypothetical protein
VTALTASLGHADDVDVVEEAPMTVDRIPSDALPGATRRRPAEEECHDTS